MRTELLSELERDKDPILITQHGLPSALSLDVESYELLQQRMIVLEGIARGEMAIAEGRVVSHAQAKKRMARWLRESGLSRRSLTWTQSPTTTP